MQPVAQSRDRLSSRGKANVVVTVDPKKTYQTLEGFGASGAWWAQALGAWTDELEHVLDLLFDRDRGVGLSIYRYNLGGGAADEIADPWRRTESFSVGPNRYNWDADRNALCVARKACLRAVDTLVLFANSAPGWMTISGSAAGHDCGLSNLKNDMYPEFCNFLLDASEFLVEKHDLPLRYISPINEPEWDWSPLKGQEGCHFSVEECIALSSLLLENMHRRGSELKLSLIDSADWKNAFDYLDALMRCSSLAKHMAHFAIHSYWSDQKDKELFIEQKKNLCPELPLWMSEWTEMKEGRDEGIETALTLARTIHEDMIVGGVTSWQYWIAVSKYDYRDGLIYVDEKSRSISETKRLWAFGQFSRFIEKHACRIEAHCRSGTGPAVCAFKNPDESIVLVLINDEADTQPLEVSIEGNYRPIGLYETSDRYSLASRQDVIEAEDTSIETAASLIKIPVDKKSIVTLVCNKWPERP